MSRALASSAQIRIVIALAIILFYTLYYIKNKPKYILQLNNII